MNPGLCRNGKADNAKSDTVFKISRAGVAVFLDIEWPLAR